MKHSFKSLAAALSLVAAGATHAARHQLRGHNSGSHGHGHGIDRWLWLYPGSGGRPSTSGRSAATPATGSRSRPHARDAALDPVLDLYFGVTTVDDSLFRTGVSWGGLQFLLTSDDVVDPPAGGPFGDPLVRLFRLPSTGQYTIAIGGGGSDGEGPYGYSMSLALQAAVPEPSAAVLMLAGVVGIAWLRGAHTRNDSASEARQHAHRKHVARLAVGRSQQVGRLELDALLADARQVAEHRRADAVRLLAPRRQWLQRPSSPKPCTPGCTPSRVRYFACHWYFMSAGLHVPASRSRSKKKLALSCVRPTSVCSTAPYSKAEPRSSPTLRGRRCWCAAPRSTGHSPCVSRMSFCQFSVLGLTASVCEPR